jgi:hypothetical protein
MSAEPRRGERSIGGTRLRRCGARSQPPGARAALLRPSGASGCGTRQPTACAVGFTLAPLRGWGSDLRSGRTPLCGWSSDVRSGRMSLGGWAADVRLEARSHRDSDFVFHQETLPDDLGLNTMR